MQAAADLLKLENDLLQPAVRNSPEALSSLLAAEFREFGSSGRVYSKEEILSSLQAAPSAGITISDFAVAMVAEGVALVTYKALRHNAATLRSSIWVWRDGRWQIVFHQGTKTGD